MESREVCVDDMYLCQSVSLLVSRECIVEVVASNMFFIFTTISRGNDPIWLTCFFQMGWFNQQLVVLFSGELGGSVGWLRKASTRSRKLAARRKNLKIHQSAPQKVAQNSPQIARFPWGFVSYPSHGFDLFRFGGCWVPVVDGEARVYARESNMSGSWKSLVKIQNPANLDASKTRWLHGKVFPISSPFILHHGSPDWLIG